MRFGGTTLAANTQRTPERPRHRWGLFPFRLRAWSHRSRATRRSAHPEGALAATGTQGSLGSHYKGDCAMSLEPEFRARIVSSRDLVEDAEATDGRPPSRRRDQPLVARHYLRRCIIEITCDSGPGPLLVSIEFNPSSHHNEPTELVRLSPATSQTLEFLVPAETPLEEVRITAKSFMASNPRTVWTRRFVLDAAI